MQSRTSSPYRMVVRRNALVPLPLLPPPPANTSVTSVRVIHNGVGADDCPPSPVSPDSPTSPTQASFYLSAKQKACGMKRPRHQRRRSCSSPCSTLPNGPLSPSTNLVTTKTTADSVVINTPYSSFGGPRRPRSTVVVTVRINNPNPSTLETAQPLSVTLPPPRPAPNTPLPQTPIASIVKPLWNKPRVSSPLTPANSALPRGPLHIVPTGRFASSSRRYVPPTDVAIMRNTNSRVIKKTGSSLAMRRWALINHSGPEIGRRIVGMGVRLAQEVWEAEQLIEQDETDDKMEQTGDEQPAIETEEKPWFEKVDQPEEDSAEQMEEANEATPSRVDDDAAATIANTELEKERERIAEECIRELEEMEIDPECEKDHATEGGEDAAMDVNASEERSEDSSSDGSSSDDDEPVSDEETSSMDVDVVSEPITPLHVRFNRFMDLQHISPKTADKQVVGSPTCHISFPIPQTWFTQLAL
ncbi:hypothetical protein FRC17_001017 [Serendipita sp. 399]|nr:hypothetical protein FRC17_001017 [Serendipita sp. 399]